MSCWATCSDQLRLRAALAAAALCLCAAPAPAQDGAFPTQEEALALAFPDAELQREETPLSEEQRQRVGELAGTVLGATTAVRYVARRHGAVVGTAYVDTRAVRTHRQTLLVALEGAGKVARVEVLAFAEPRQYLPRPPFFAQFLGRDLGDGVQLRRGIRPVAGATLSARATTDAVRTALALHQVLGGPVPQPPPREEPGCGCEIPVGKPPAPGK
jgi:hypothetical protein